MPKVKMMVRVPLKLDSTGWKRVDAYQHRTAGMLFGIHRTIPGTTADRWTVTEWLTGLKVCGADTLDQAHGKLSRLAGDVSMIVQKLWDDEASGYDPDAPRYFSPCANDMDRSAYEALVAGEYGKVAR